MAICGNTFLKSHDLEAKPVGEHVCMHARGKGINLYVCTLFSSFRIRNFNQFDACMSLCNGKKEFRKALFLYSQQK